MSIQIKHATHQTSVGATPQHTTQHTHTTQPWWQWWRIIYTGGTHEKSWLLAKVHCVRWKFIVFCLRNLMVFYKIQSFLANVHGFWRTFIVLIPIHCFLFWKLHCFVKNPEFLWKCVQCTLYTVHCTLDTAHWRNAWFLTKVHDFWRNFMLSGNSLWPLAKSWFLKKGHCILRNFIAFGRTSRMSMKICAMSGVQCPLSTIHCTMYNVLCTLYNVHCTLRNVPTISRRKRASAGTATEPTWPHNKCIPHI